MLGMIASHGGIALVPASLCAIGYDGVVYRELAEAAQLYIDVSIAYFEPVGNPALLPWIALLRARGDGGASPPALKFPAWRNWPGPPYPVCRTRRVWRYRPCRRC